MGVPRKRAQERSALVADYKVVLRAIIDKRPSGTRQKLALVLGKHKSFISQITNPVYSVPLPAQHVEPILAACHCTAEERAAFMAVYRRAHPDAAESAARARGGEPARMLEIPVPRMADARRQRALEDAIRDVARRMIELARNA